MDIKLNALNNKIEKAISENLESKLGFTIS